MAQYPLEPVPEARRRVVRPRPACGGYELLLARTQVTQIGLVLARSLIDQRIELEVNLIEPRREMHRERRSVAALLELRPTTDRPPLLRDVLAARGLGLAPNG